MWPRMAKMSSGREVDVIFGHLKRKMAVKIEVRRNNDENTVQMHVLGPKMV